MPNENQDLPATEQSTTDQSTTDQQLPPHVKQAIQMHQDGSQMKLMWVHPKLAEDLNQFYGGQGLLSVHDPKLHGEIGDNATASPTPAQTPPEQQPTAIAIPAPSPEPNPEGGSELPGQAKPEANQPTPNDNSSLIGPGVRFDGKQYLYWDGSTWKPANIGPLKSQANTPPGLA